MPCPNLVKLYRFVEQRCYGEADNCMSANCDKFFFLFIYFLFLYGDITLTLFVPSLLMFASFAATDVAHFI